MSQKSYYHQLAEQHFPFPTDRDRLADEVAKEKPFGEFFRHCPPSVKERLFEAIRAGKFKQAKFHYHHMVSYAVRNEILTAMRREAEGPQDQEQQAIARLKAAVDAYGGSRKAKAWWE